MSSMPAYLRCDEPVFEMSESDVEQLADELCAYHAEFADLFYRTEQRQWANKYLQGLLLPGIGKSVEEMALALEGGNVRNMQQFVGAGRWDDTAILQKHAELVADSLGTEDGVLIIDGTQFPKKGKYSAGVASQWCGVLGKVENCQAGVFLAYASKFGHTLLDRRLYLPQQWFEDSSRQRWQRCGIPDDTQFRTKPQLAWEMIQRVLSQDVLPFGWVLADETYGANTQLLRHLEQQDLLYLMDVPVSTRVWLQRPQTEVVDAQSTAEPRLTEDAPQPIEVGQLAQRLRAQDWMRCRIKEGEKGPIDADFAFVRAVAVRDKLPGPDLWVVFRRSVSDPSELKAFISNAPADTLHTDLVRLTGMRWPVETCFDEAKGNLGMDEYQVRSWLGWHHHMTLVILAHHFLVRMKLKHKKGHRTLP